MKAIELVRVRIAYAPDALAMRQIGLRAPKIAPVDAIRARVLGRLIELVHGGSDPWRLAALPNRQARAAGFFGPRSLQPLLVARFYARARHRVEVELVRELVFPWSLDAVVAHLRPIFPSLTTIQPVCTINTLLPSRRKTYPAYSWSAASRSAGAPALACNVWLAEQLARMPDPSYYHALYKPWLARYYALRGFYPQDPRRSFRAAVASAVKRLGLFSSASAARSKE